MYEQLTAGAANVVKIASRIARGYEQDYVGTEHILLAIVQEDDDTVGPLLRRFGIDEYNLTSEIEKLVRDRLEETWVFGRLPGTPHYRNVVATAIAEAQALQAAKVDVRHLLLALLREKGCVAQTALQRFGLRYEHGLTEARNADVVPGERVR